MRGMPVSISVPTAPNSKPKKTIAPAFVRLPEEMTIDIVNPKTISEKYSTGPKSSAACASNGPRKETAAVATVPAKNDDKAAVARAAPARPRRAI
ncbi:hypothetical protein ABIA22_005832 [Sinorhizobium fredii]